MTNTMFWTDWNDPYTLRGMSGEWNMDFVSEGEEALTLMKTKPYDIIVSDMQMPGMSGEELLGKVEQQYPSTARVVLSGHADQDTTYRMVGSNHLFISKPCSAELLIDTMRKSISLSNTQAMQTGGYASTYVDITEHKRAENKIKQSHLQNSANSQINPF